MLLAIVWVAAWLPIGLWAGDPDYVLSVASRGTFARQLYQILLYCGLFAVFLDSWHRSPPEKPKWGRPRLFAFFFVQGVIATVIFRGALAYFGYAQWEWAGTEALFWLQVATGTLVVALAEEAIFRGFLLGKLIAGLGPKRGAVLTSLIFASVHLFRPGSATFKLSYGIGLFILGMLLAHLAWHYNSLFASAGFHGGVILLNIATKLKSFQPSLLAGWNSEPVSGLVCWIFTLLFWVSWWGLIRHRGKE